MCGNHDSLKCLVEDHVLNWQVYDPSRYSFLLFLLREVRNFLGPYAAVVEA
jgi:hypothetical protein